MIYNLISKIYNLKSIIFLLFVLVAIYFWRIFPPLSSTDTYFHLSVGRWVALHHQIPQYDTFTFVAPNKKWISDEWLSGLALYLTYVNFGDLGILILRTLVGTLMIFFIYQSLKTNQVKFKLRILAITTAAVTISLRLFDRPEMFSFLIFSILFFLLENYIKNPKSKYLLPLPLIFLLWANIQGYAPIGIVVFGFYLVRKLLETWQSKDQKLIPVLISQKIFIGFFLASFLAATGTPGQFRRFFYAFFLNKDLFGVITEVKSLPDRLAQIKYDFWLNIPLEVYLLLSIAIVGLVVILLKFSKKTLLVNLSELAFFLFILGLGFRFFRTIPLSIFLVSPLVFRKINDATLKAKGIFLDIPVVILGLAMLLIMVISISQGRLWGYKTNYLFVFDKSGQIMVAATNNWKEKQPIQALRFIQQNFKPKRILTALNWSNQVIWVFNEKVKVFADIIYEKQTRETLDDYGKLAGGQAGWQEALVKYNPDIIINTQYLNIGDLFVVPVYELKNWKLVYVDDVVAVYAKDEIITQENQVLSAIHPEYSNDLKFKLEETEEAQKELVYLIGINPKNAFATNQQILLEMQAKNYKKATELAQNATKLFPKDPNFYFLLAASQIAQGNCSQVALPLSRAKNLAGGYYYIKREVENLIATCNLKI